MSRDVYAAAGLYLGAGAALLGLAALVRPLPALGLAPRARGAALGLGGLLLAGVAVALPAAEVRVAHPRSALDLLLPQYQFVERHAVRVQAPPEATLRAVRAVTADEIRLFRTLTWVRRLGRPGPASLLDPPAGVPIADVALRSGFVTLVDTSVAETHELVYGALGPVTPAARARRARPPRTPDAFRALAEPGFAKMALYFNVGPDGRGGSVVATETRVFATDPATRRRFATYWRVIYPGSALIRRSWLAAIRRRAECSSGE